MFDLFFYLYRFRKYVSCGFPIINFCTPGVHYETPRIFVAYLISNNPYPTAFPYGNGMVLHFYQQQESSTTKTVHKVINKGLKTYV